MERAIHYWGFRINTNETIRKYIKQQLDLGCLRQGWGYNPGQDLRNLTVDEGAKRNLRMLKEVKKGDILLIPRIPEWSQVTIVEATEDWDKGYKFEIGEYGDFGHCFPARAIKAFNRHGENVDQEIRSTLHNVSRFWRIWYPEQIQKILNSEDVEINNHIGTRDRFNSSIEASFAQVFDQESFRKVLKDNFDRQFNGSEWENALIEGLKLLFPEPIFTVERVGGTSEKEHGTDISITMLNPLTEFKYIIAIQVKDYSNFVSNYAAEQVNKAEYWNDIDKQQKLIEKIVIITKANKDENKHLEQSYPDINFIFSDRLSQILSMMGMKYMKKHLTE